MESEGVRDKLALQSKLVPKKRKERTKADIKVYPGLKDTEWAMRSHISGFLLASSLLRHPHLMGAHEKFYIWGPGKYLVLSWDFVINRSC